jgi:hypothetical protein
MLVAIASFGTLVTLFSLVLFKDKPLTTNKHPFYEIKDEVWPPKLKFSMREELRMLS